MERLSKQRPSSSLRRPRIVWRRAAAAHILSSIIHLASQRGNPDTVEIDGAGRLMESTRTCPMA